LSAPIFGIAGRELRHSLASQRRIGRARCRNFAKDLAPRTGRFPQLVDPRSSVNGLLLTFHVRRDHDARREANELNDLIDTPA